MTLVMFACALVIPSYTISHCTILYSHPVKELPLLQATHKVHMTHCATHEHL